MFVSIHVCSRSFNDKLTCTSIYLSTSAVEQTNETVTTKNKFIRYLCFIVVVFIHICRHRLKMSSFSLKKKKKFRSIDLTCCILIQITGSPFPVPLESAFPCFSVSQASYGIRGRERFPLDFPRLTKCFM